MALSVVPHGPAEQAGVRAGDLIETFAGLRITKAQEIRNITQKHKPGDIVALSVMHEGKSAIKTLTIGNYPTEWNVALERERERE